MTDNVKNPWNQKPDNQPKKDRTAIALSYNPEDAAPKIVATGKGYLADKILNGAKENKIPVHKDEQLTAALSKLDIGNYIPPELYDVVSEILIFVDNMDRIKSKVLPKGDT